MCAEGKHLQKKESEIMRKESILSDFPVREAEIRNWWLRPNKRIGQGIKKINYSTTVCWADGSITRNRLQRGGSWSIRKRHRKRSKKNSRWRTDTDMKTAEGGKRPIWQERIFGDKKRLITSMVWGPIQPESNIKRSQTWGLNKAHAW